MEDLDSSLEKARQRTLDVAEIKREMQTALLLENAPSEEDKDAFDVYVVDWISENRDIFTNAFEQLLNRSPELLEKWKKNPETYLEQIKVLMEQ